MPDPAPDRHLLAVYETEEQAVRAAEAARRAGAAGARIGAPADHVHALRSEMREELEHGFILPHAGVALPEEAAKGFAVTLPIAALIGIVVVTPLGFIPLGGSLATRLLVAAIVGAAMGATVAFVVGAGTAVRGRFEASAADRGVTVHITTDTREIEAALPEEGRIRLDRVRADGTPVVTLDTEADHDEAGVVQDMASRVRSEPHVAGHDDRSEPRTPLDADPGGDDGRPPPGTAAGPR